MDVKKYVWMLFATIVAAALRFIFNLVRLFWVFVLAFLTLLLQFQKQSSQSRFH